MTILYGIKNCDSVKKARQWLEQHQITYQFHDFRSDGLSAHQVSIWVELLGWERLINKRSTSWKALDDDVKRAMSATTAIAAILTSPTLIKRPLLATRTQLIVGFKDANYQALLL